MADTDPEKAENSDLTIPAEKRTDETAASQVHSTTDSSIGFLEESHPTEDNDESVSTNVEDNKMECESEDPKLGAHLNVEKPAEKTENTEADDFQMECGNENSKLPSMVSNVEKSPLESKHMTKVLASGETVQGEESNKCEGAIESMDESSETRSKELKQASGIETFGESVGNTEEDKMDCEGLLNMSGSSHKSGQTPEELKQEIKTGDLFGSEGHKLQCEAESKSCTEKLKEFKQAPEISTSGESVKNSGEEGKMECDDATDFPEAVTNRAENLSGQSAQASTGANIGNVVGGKDSEKSKMEVREGKPFCWNVGGALAKRFRNRKSPEKEETTPEEKYVEGLEFFEDCVVNIPPRLKEKKCQTSKKFEMSPGEYFHGKLSGEHTSTEDESPLMTPDKIELAKSSDEELIPSKMSLVIKGAEPPRRTSPLKDVYEKCMGLVGSSKTAQEKSVPFYASTQTQTKNIEAGKMELSPGGNFRNKKARDQTSTEDESSLTTPDEIETAKISNEVLIPSKMSLVIKGAEPPQRMGSLKVMYKKIKGFIGSLKTAQSVPSDVLITTQAESAEAEQVGQSSMENRPTTSLQISLPSSSNTPSEANKKNIFKSSLKIKGLFDRLTFADSKASTDLNRVNPSDVVVPPGTPSSEVFDDNSSIATSSSVTNPSSDTSEAISVAGIQHMRCIYPVSHENRKQSLPEPSQAINPQAKYGEGTGDTDDSKAEKLKQSNTTQVLKPDLMKESQTPTPPVKVEDEESGKEHRVEFKISPKRTQEDQQKRTPPLQRPCLEDPDEQPLMSEESEPQNVNVENASQSPSNQPPGLQSPAEQLSDLQSPTDPSFSPRSLSEEDAPSPDSNSSDSRSRSSASGGKRRADVDDTDCPPKQPKY